MNNIFRKFCGVLLASSMCLAVSASRAQSGYPDHAIRLIVGFPPGTSPDVVARLVAQKLGDQLKQSVIVDNVPGAGGLIAAQAASKAPADGYTLFMNTVTDMSIAPHTYSKLAYDPASFVLISPIMYSDLALVVPSKLPVKTLPDYISWARGQKPLFMASLGPGTPAHFGIVSFAKAFDVQAEPVHYKSAADALVNVASGDVSGIFGSLALVSPFINDGKLRALAVSSPTRLPALPNVPTFRELGHADVLNDAWVGLAFPPLTPSAIADRLSTEVQKTMLNPEVRERLEALGLRSASMTRPQFAEYAKQDSARWANVVKLSGFKVD